MVNYGKGFVESYLEDIFKEIEKENWTYSGNGEILSPTASKINDCFMYKNIEIIPYKESLDKLTEKEFFYQNSKKETKNLNKKEYRLIIYTPSEFAKGIREELSDKAVNEYNFIEAILDFTNNKVYVNKNIQERKKEKCLIEIIQGDFHKLN